MFNCNVRVQKKPQKNARPHARTLPAFVAASTIAERLVAFGLQVANPPSELATLRNGSLSNVSTVTIAANTAHMLSGTGGGAAASADVVVSFAVKAGQPSDFGVCVLSSENRSSGIAIAVDLAPVKASNGSSGGFKATVIQFSFNNNRRPFSFPFVWGL